MSEANEVVQTTYDDFKWLTDDKLKTLQLCLNNGRYHEVVASIGLVPEFGIKAVICKERNFDFYPISKPYITHVLNNLVGLCSLKDDLDERRITDENFYTAWSIISKWDITLRYKPTGDGDKSSAESYMHALSEGGILSWIKSKW